MVNAAVITAAGKSLRIGKGIKKEFQYLDDKPVLICAILPFIETGKIDSLVITVPESQIEYSGQFLSKFIKNIDIELVAGGDTRQKSVLNGLNALKKINPDYVLIHDGARPWVSAELIKSVLNAVHERNACIPVIKSQDAMKNLNSQGEIIKNLPRESTFCAQTPQGFKYSEILKAHQLAVSDSKDYIDDSEIYTEYIGAVYTVPGDVKNRKITYKHDLEQ